MSNFGGSDSQTTKITKTTTVSDQAQLVGKNANVAQGGATQFNDSILAPVFNQKGAKGSSVNYTVNSGVDEIALSSLLGNLTSGLTASTGAQIAASSQAQSDQLDTFKSLLTQKKETEEGSPKTFSYVAIAAIAALAWIFSKRL